MIHMNFVQSLYFIGCYSNINGKFSENYSKFFSSEAMGMMLKFSIHVYDISLYISCVFYCRCPCGFFAMT